jgi:hypothetical protein
VNGEHKKSTKGKGHGGAKNYFKCGAYMNKNYGDEVQISWKDIKITHAPKDMADDVNNNSLL